jgi:hypothetical protein
MPRSLVDVYRRFGRTYCLDDGGSIFLWNAGIFTPDYMASYPRRWYSLNFNFVCLIHPSFAFLKIVLITAYKLSMGAIRIFSKGTRGNSVAYNLMFKPSKTIFTNCPTVFRTQYILKIIDFSTSINILYIFIFKCWSFSEIRCMQIRGLLPPGAHIYESYPQFLVITDVFIISDRVLMFCF